MDIDEEKALREMVRQGLISSTAAARKAQQAGPSAPAPQLEAVKGQRRIRRTIYYTPTEGEWEQVAASAAFKSCHIKPSLNRL